MISSTMKPSATNFIKLASKAVLALYIFTLLWLVLFKLSFDLPSVLLDYQSRSLNLIPFLGFSRGNGKEIIENFIIFIPFGLLLSVDLKRLSFWRKLAIMFIVSLAVETLQFVFAIGTTDITDVITNTFGGFIGLVLYDVCHKYVDEDKLDRFIVVAAASVLILLLLLRIFVLRVRY